MGSKLARSAFEFVGTHNDRARREGFRELDVAAVALLALMALTALDEDDDPMYFAGWKTTAASLGLPETQTARKRVQRATDALLGAGAIERLTRGYRDSTARFRLSYAKGTPESPNRPDKETPESPNPPDWGTGKAERGTPQAEQRDTGVPPRREEEQREEERAREFTLEEPRQPRTHLEPRPYPEQCEAHQLGPHTAPCRACGQTRRAHQRIPTTSAEPLRHLMLDGRRVCANKPHQVAANGSCNNCEIRADDLAALLTGAAP